MIFEAKLRLIGEKPRIERILEREQIVHYSFEELHGNTLVELRVQSLKQLFEVKRRLGGKRGRKTQVEIIGILKGDDDAVAV